MSCLLHIALRDAKSKDYNMQIFLYISRGQSRRNVYNCTHSVLTVHGFCLSRFCNTDWSFVQSEV